MKIEELYLKNFGKFHGERIGLGSGIQVFYGENESGKSTLHTFIRSMLFGMERQRGRASRTDLFSIYEPWENPGYYAGNLKFECGGKKFRLERNFDRVHKSARLICETDGEELSIPHGDLEMLIGGLSESRFLNTVYVSQAGGRTGESLCGEIQNYLANYQQSGDSTVDVEKAASVLQRRWRELDKELKQQRWEEDILKQEEYHKIAYLHDEIAVLEEKLDILKKRRMHIEAQREEQRQPEKQKEQQQPEQREAQQLRQRGQMPEQQSRRAGSGKHSASAQGQKAGVTQAQLFPAVLCLAIALIQFAAGAFLSLSYVQWSALLWLIPGMALSSRRYRRRAAAAERSAAEEHEAADSEYTMEKKEAERERPSLSEKVSEAAQHMQKLDWEIAHLNGELQEKQDRCENLQQEAERPSYHGERIRTLEEDCRAVKLAMSAIAELSKNLQGRMGRRLDEAASVILEELTEGRYRKIHMDEKMRITVHAQDRILDLHQVSFGTAQQIYFAVRMGIARYFCDQEAMPLILDEVFSAYDEKRLAQALRWMCDNQEQVLLFTCQKRELECLQALGIPYKRYTIPS